MKLTATDIHPYDQMLICEPEARVQAGKVKVEKTVGNIATLR